MIYDCEKITMSDGNENYFHHWLPENDIEMIVVLSHGMTEYAFRYDDFGKFLVQNNIALYAEDHRGHGKTAELAEEKGTGKFGYLADKNGFFRVVDDIKEEVDLVKQRYPGKKVVLFGHSFGSFVAQCYIEQYGDSVDGAVICGSAGPRGIVYPGKIVANMVKAFAGAKNVSLFLEKLAFGSCDEGWLTRDEEILKKYAGDKWCNFHCTTGFYADLLDGLCYIHAKKNMKKIPSSLPILIISGTADPVGSYGKTVERLFDVYDKNGIDSLSMRLYDGARHELLNEINRDEVKSDVLEWLKTV